MTVRGGGGVTEARVIELAAACVPSGGAVAWGDITDKPTAYNPTDHLHLIAEITGLQIALDGKQPVGSYALGDHGHLIAEITGLEAALGAKADTGHSHTIANVTGLQGALDGKQAAGSYEVGGAVAAHEVASNPHPVYLTQAEADALYQAAGGGGGADPWTYAKLANDFTTSSATAVDAGLAFTPAANKQYEFEALLLLRTATATVGPRPGLAWPTGGTDGAADVYTPSSATAQTMVFGNIAGAMLAAVGGLPNTTQSYPARIAGTFRAGASPSGTIRVQLASETAGTVVTLKAGSFLKYREI